MHTKNDTAMETFRVGATTSRILLPASAGAAHSIVEMEVPGGFRGPPVPHHHTRESCTWVVLDGTLELEIEGETQRVEAGRVAHVEPHENFVWRNGDEAAPLRMLCIYSPGGFEAMLAKAMHALAEKGEAGATPAALAEVMGPLWRQFGIGVAGTPPSVE